MYRTLTNCNLRGQSLYSIIFIFTVTWFNYDLTLANSLSESTHAPLVTDRPDQTESSLSVPVGALQVEMGATRMDDGSAGGGQSELSFPQTLVRIGAVPGFELRLGFDGASRTKAGSSPSITGMGDLELGAKMELVSDRKSKTTVAVLGSITLPTGEDGFTADGYYPSARLSVAHDFSETISLGYNLGVTSSSSAIAENETESFGLYTIALGAGVSPSIGVYFEAFGETRLDGPSKPSHSLDGGFTYLLADRTQLDFSGGIGLSESADDWFLSAGVSFRLFR